MQGCTHIAFVTICIKKKSINVNTVKRLSHDDFAGLRLLALQRLVIFAHYERLRMQNKLCNSFPVRDSASDSQ